MNMFFSKKEKDRNLDDIKDMMDDEETPVRESKYEPRRAERQIHEEIPTEREHAAPLFVKVDKYKELITSIHELKLYLGATKQVFALFNDLEAVRSETLNVMRATVQRLERTIVEMDTELLRPRGINVMPDKESADVGHIENSLTDLHKQLMELKRELQELK